MGEGPDICLAAGFFPGNKEMILNNDNNLNTNTSVLFKDSKRYYYAGFNTKKNEKIQHCQMGEAKTTKSHKNPVTDSPDGQTPQTCSENSLNISAQLFTNTGGPKVNSMTLLVTGLRILLAKCVAINVLMSVKAFLF